MKKARKIRRGKKKKRRSREEQKQCRGQFRGFKHVIQPGREGDCKLGISSNPSVVPSKSGGESPEL